jgi:hypothetical protein
MMRGLTVFLFVAGLVFAAGSGCDSKKTQPSLDGTRPELKQRPAPGGPGEGRKGKSDPQPQ